MNRTIMQRLDNALSISPWIDKKEACKRIGVSTNVLGATLSKNGWNFGTFKDAKIKELFGGAE